MYGDLLGGAIMSRDDGVVPDEVRPVPRDVVAWTQSGRIVDVLVAAVRATTDGGQRGLGHRATVTRHLRYKTQIIYLRHSALLRIVVAAAWAQSSVDVVTTEQNERRLHHCSDLLIRELLCELQFSQFLSVSRLHDNVLPLREWSANHCKIKKLITYIRCTHKLRFSKVQCASVNVSESRLLV